LPDSAYDTVLRETPACLATSPMVLIVAPLLRRTGSKALVPPASTLPGGGLVATHDVSAHTALVNPEDVPVIES
jgi:hypothetical protein